MASQNTGKKRAQGRSNTADTRKPRVATVEQIERQLEWRRNSLLERVFAGHYTSKNEKEAKRLQVKF